MARIPRITLFFFFVFLFYLQLLPRLVQDSLTTDEPYEISYGYHLSYYPEDSLRWNYPGGHLPFIPFLQSAGLHFLPLEKAPNVPYIYQCFVFFNQNASCLDALAFLPRLVTVFFATGVAWILWNLLNPLGFAAVFAGLSLWAFEPSFLAYSGYALADVPAAFFFLLSTLFFVFSKRSPGVFSETLSGLFLGLAILSKFYNLILFIVFLILEKTEITCDSMHLRLRRWLLALGLPFFLVGLAFSGATQKHFYDPWLVFFENLKDLLAYRLENRPGYLFGETFQEFRMAYYPWVLFFKTSLPLLFLSIIGLMALIPHRKDAWLWVPGIAYFSVTLFSQTVGGVRYLMPLYPFLFLWGALGFHRLWTRQGTYRRAARFGAGGLLLWQAISSAASWPQHLAYFNDFVPPSQKMFVLGDNNYDIGQNNRRFARWWRNQNLPPVRLALLGGRDPYFYGLRWEPWHESDLSAPEPGTVYAVNAAFLQIAPALFPYTRAIAESWIRKIPPTARVAETWFVWIFPGKPAEKKEKVFVYSCPFLSYYRTVDSRRTFPWPAPPPSAVRF